MDAGVPVKTAIEDRVQRLGCGGIIRPVQHMVQLVRIFACDMAKRDGGKTASQIGIEALGIGLGHGDQTLKAKRVMSAILAANRIRAVGAWTLMTL